LHHKGLGKVRSIDGNPKLHKKHISKTRSTIVTLLLFWCALIVVSSVYLTTPLMNENKNNKLKFRQMMLELEFYFFYAFFANKRLISIMTFVAFSILSTETYSNLPWKFSPPVKMFGVGRPLYESCEPSVPPRIGSMTGSI